MNPRIQYLTIPYRVLDHGYVKYIDHMGDDLSYLESARMSTDNPTGVSDKADNGLREYLWKHEHTSPFESNELVIEMKVPIAILREWDRHRTLTEEWGEVYTVDEFTRKWMNRNEYSLRYAEAIKEFYVPELSRIKGQGGINKQAGDVELSNTIKEIFIEKLKTNSLLCVREYENAIRAGVSRELARFLLPFNMYTKIRLKGCALNWLKALKLRQDSDAQWEIQQYANIIATIISEIWPKLYQVYQEHTLMSTKLSGSETQMVSDLLNSLSQINPGYLELLLQELTPKKQIEFKKKLRLL